MLTIGSVIYLYNENRRVYERDPDTGRSLGGPIWREHWKAHTIVAETSRSWVLDNERKVPKYRKPVWHLSEPCYSEAELAERVWLERHRQSIGAVVQASVDYHGVLACAIAIGYKS